MDKEILETIQKIGAIFATKNIRSAPFSADLVNPPIPLGMERIVILELIIYLDDLMKKHLKSNKKLHPYYAYIQHFYEILDNNTSDNSLISQRKLTYG